MEATRRRISPGRKKKPTERKDGGQGRSGSSGFLEYITPLTPEEKRAAGLVSASQAKDKEELSMFLDMLGINGSPEDTTPQGA